MIKLYVRREDVEEFLMGNIREYFGYTYFLFSMSIEDDEVTYYIEVVPERESRLFTYRLRFKVYNEEFLILDNIDQFKDFNTWINNVVATHKTLESILNRSEDV